MSYFPANTVQIPIFLVEAALGRRLSPTQVLAALWLASDLPLEHKALDLDELVSWDERAWLVDCLRREEIVAAPEVRTTDAPAAAQGATAPEPEADDAGDDEREPEPDFGEQFAALVREIMLHPNPMTPAQLADMEATFQGNLAHARLVLLLLHDYELRAGARTSVPSSVRKWLEDSTVERLVERANALLASPRGARSAPSPRPSIGDQALERVASRVPTAPEPLGPRLAEQTRKYTRRAS